MFPVTCPSQLFLSEAWTTGQSCQARTGRPRLLAVGRCWWRCRRPCRAVESSGSAAPPAVRCRGRDGVPGVGKHLRPLVPVDGVCFLISTASLIQHLCVCVCDSSAGSYMPPTKTADKDTSQETPVALLMKAAVPPNVKVKKKKQPKTFFALCPK